MLIFNNFSDIGRITKGPKKIFYNLKDQFDLSQKPSNSKYHLYNVNY